MLTSTGISPDTKAGVAMTLRPADAETGVLRRRAELEQRPMQEVVRQAIREYVESHALEEPAECEAQPGLAAAGDDSPARGGGEGIGAAITSQQKRDRVRGDHAVRPAISRRASKTYWPG